MWEVVRHRPTHVAITAGVGDESTPQSDLRGRAVDDEAVRPSPMFGRRERESSDAPTDVDDRTVSNSVWVVVKEGPRDG